VKISSEYKPEKSEVEITIKKSDIQEKSRNVTAEEFISKWKGFLKTDIDPNQTKFDYLSEKYR
jgi:hypothetical protein